MRPHLPSRTYRALTLRDADDDDFRAPRKHIPGSHPSSSLTSLPLAMDRHSSFGSIFTDTSAHDSLFSKLSEADSSIIEPAQASAEVLPCGSGSKDKGTDDLPDTFFGPVLNLVRELKYPPYTVVVPC